MIDLFLPFITQPRVTFSEPPTAKVASVYRLLGVTKDRRDPMIVVRVGPVDSPVASRPGQTVTALWNVTEQVDGSAVVTIDPATGRKEIARALVEALD